jgi:apolipoprotein D and lipocalin family protein
MKTYYTVLPLLMATALFGQQPPLTVVDDVDLERYAGTWYEIARLPNRFQDRCAGDVTATYTLLDDGSIQVVNRCRKEDGDYIEAEGRARRAAKNGSNAKLKVRFAPRILSFLPFVWGDYWIIELDPDYRYAVVGDPRRKYLWVLAREPVLEGTTLEGIFERTSDKGFDLSEVIRTRHSIE